MTVRGSTSSAETQRLDVGVLGDQREDLEGLTLVLVQTLDHGVEHGVGVEVEAVFALGVGGEVLLVGLLDGGELLDEFVVLGEGFEALEQFDLAQPLVGAEAFGDEGAAQVGEADEATGGDAVGDVGELVAVEVGEVRRTSLSSSECSSATPLTWEPPAVARYAMRTLGFSSSVTMRMRSILALSRVLVLVSARKCSLIRLDDFHVAGQQFGDQLGRPDFQRLGSRVWQV